MRRLGGATLPTPVEFSHCESQYSSHQCPEWNKQACRLLMKGQIGFVFFSTCFKARATRTVPSAEAREIESPISIPRFVYCQISVQSILPNRCLQTTHTHSNHSPKDILA
jgi:hypothetical protein